LDFKFLINANGRVATLVKLNQAESRDFENKKFLGGPDAVSHGQSRLVAVSCGVLRKKRLFILRLHRGHHWGASTRRTGSTRRPSAVIDTPLQRGKNSVENKEIKPKSNRYRPKNNGVAAF
jgi:hypothetical protein